MPVPERWIAPVHVVLETDRASTTREWYGVRHRHRSSVMVLMMVLRRLPSRRLVITDGPPVVIVTVAAKTTVVTATVIFCTVVAFRIANAIVIAVVVVVVLVVVIGIGATTITAGTQRAADEREQLLHVPVELVGQTGNAGAVGRLRRRRRDVTQHVRFEVHELGVPLLLLRQWLWRQR